jgi:hypothetical protein
VRVTQDVQYIAEDRRVEILSDGAKQLDFRLHSRTLSARALNIGVWQDPVNASMSLAGPATMERSSEISVPVTGFRNRRRWGLGFGGLIFWGMELNPKRNVRILTNNRDSYV